MRDALKNLYSIIKGADAHLRFAFLTGVSKFSKVSLFSGLNNLVDITLDKKFSAICGYTEQDLDTVFAHELDGLDRALVKEWYNGYNWLGEAVYNPFDLLLLFRDREFRSYWFETGNPSFLIKLLLKREFFLPELSKVYSSDRLLSTFDVDRIATEALLFQTGYLTIKAHRFVPGKIEIELGYPNREVKAALNECLMDALVHYEAGLEKSRRRMEEMFLQQNIQGMGELVKSLFASIPYQWYVNNQIAHYEGYYASVFYAYFTSMGLDVVAEESSNVGRLDMGLRHGSAVYLFEFKVIENDAEGTALTQIEQNDYAEKYRGEDVTIYSIGVEFSKAKRQIVTWDWKKENGKQLTESKT